MNSGDNWNRFYSIVHGQSDKLQYQVGQAVPLTCDFWVLRNFISQRFVCSIDGCQLQWFDAHTYVCGITWDEIMQFCAIQWHLFALWRHRISIASNLFPSLVPSEELHRTRIKKNNWSTSVAVWSESSQIPLKWATKILAQEGKIQLPKFVETKLFEGFILPCSILVKCIVSAKTCNVEWHHPWNMSLW